MKNCPICNIEIPEENYFYCKNCAWDFTTDPTITNFINPISENFKKQYVARVKLSKNLWNQNKILNNEIFSITKKNQDLIDRINILEEKIKYVSNHNLNKNNNPLVNSEIITNDGCPFIEIEKNKFISILPITNKQFKKTSNISNVSSLNELKNVFITDFNLKDLSNFLDNLLLRLIKTKNNIKSVRIAAKTDFPDWDNQNYSFKEIKRNLTSSLDTEIKSILDFILNIDNDFSFQKLVNILRCNELVKMGSNTDQFGIRDNNQNVHVFLNDKTSFKECFFRVVIILED